jgi:esterase/lipase superfamily enzyme
VRTAYKKVRQYAPLFFMQEQYHNDYSPMLGRHMEMLVFGHSGRPIILFPTSMGRHYQNKDFKLIDSAAWFVEQGLVKIYCPDSVDEESWYNKSIHPADRVRRHLQYDAYIRHEVVPRAMHETGHSRVITAGASFGAYHATNFGFRYPSLTSAIFNMGGAYDIRERLDGYYDENAFYNNPIDFIPGLTDPAIYHFGTVIGSAEHDFCLQDNYQLAGILASKGLRYWLDVRPNGNHDWPIWREMFPNYISEALK